jgi:hypothetical protein
MNRLRTTLVLSYAIIGVVVLGMALGIWRRSRDSLWTTTLAEVRWNYDLLAIAVIGFALAVAIGLLQRREWGRVFCISLSFIVLGLRESVWVVLGGEFVCNPHGDWRSGIPQGARNWHHG